MFERIEEVEQRYEELEAQLEDPEILSDYNLYNEVNRELVSIRPLVQTYRKYKSVLAAIKESKDLLSDSDPEIRELVKEELSELEPSILKLAQELKLLMLPTDPMGNRNVILEIRAGTGGDESALFAGDLLNMYSRYANNCRWKVESMSFSEGTVGGYKEVVVMISGDNVYATLKWESGVHRVQRVPETETQGRVHTSACTVAILPEADEVDLEVRTQDLRIDTYRASGSGGQHVNKTNSAIRITHIPTGLIVQCQDEKSQHKNKAKAMKVLSSRLYDQEQQKLHRERASERKDQVGSGDRSERIRTYNYPQNRITDHRIGLTLYKLDRIVFGELQEVIDALNTADQVEQLKALDR